MAERGLHINLFLARDERKGLLVFMRDTPLTVPVMLLR